MKKKRLHKLTEDGRIAEIERGESTMQNGKPLKVVANINQSNIIGDISRGKNEKLQNGLKYVAEMVETITKATVSPNYEKVKKKLISVVIDECGQVLYKDLGLPDSPATTVIEFCETKDSGILQENKEYFLGINEIINSNKSRTKKIIELNEYIVDMWEKHGHQSSEQYEQALRALADLKAERSVAQKKMEKYMVTLPEGVDPHDPIEIDITEDVNLGEQGGDLGLPNETNMIPFDEESGTLKKIIKDVTQLGKANKKHDLFLRGIKVKSEKIKSEATDELPEDAREALRFLKASAAAKKGWKTRRKNENKRK